MVNEEVCPKDPEGKAIITWVKDDYDWYGEGDYEIYDCTLHGRHTWQLPD